MTEPGDVTQDRGFKALFTFYPVETVEVFAPELIAEHGRPVTILPVQQEIQLPNLGNPNRFFDIALHCTWGDGFQAIVVLTEHWSEVRKVDLDRVLLYLASLRVQYECDVLPIVLVTDPSAREVPDRLASTVGSLAVLDFRVRVVRTRPDDLPWLRRCQNRVSIMLQAFALWQVLADPAVCMTQIVVAFRRAPGPLEHVPYFLPMMTMAVRMPESDEPRFRQLIREEPDMINVFDEVASKSRAEGKAEGHAEGRISEIRQLVDDGLLSVDAARKAIQKLIATKVVPADIGEDALSKLG